MDDKIIVSNRLALKTKYGAAGVTAINKALQQLIAADKKRAITSRVLFIDDTAAMKRLGAKAVDGVRDYRAAKAAIDRIFKKLKPDYLMILGSHDVVPHQDLRNPAYVAGDDDDEIAFGDLPYACDAGYGRDPAQFVGPTRVVGRLPDLTGADEPSHLLALLKTATNWKGLKTEDYASYFGLSTHSWRISTKKSLDDIFGNSGTLKLSPPRGPKFTKAQLGTRSHFINCHGGRAAPEFYGEKGTTQPICMTTKAIAKAIRLGTVAAVECCYGAELYDSITLGLDMPICQSYLRQGCIGFLGSTTIAYGPADENGAADWICQFFLLNVLDGASLGRAALMARQQFVENTAQMDAMDLKTLAQFCLYGDPSLHPVAKSTGAVPHASAEQAERFRRSERRAKLKAKGDYLQNTKPTASKPKRQARVTPTQKSTLANLAGRAGLPRGQQFVAYQVKGAKRAGDTGTKAASAPSTYYIAVAKAKTLRGQPLRVAVVAKELAGRIIDYCVYEQR
jgi:hypothetical protein